MAERPKSFFKDPHRVTDQDLPHEGEWVTAYDHLPDLKVEAELIHILHRAGIPLHHADQLELWELAAAVGLHRTERVIDRDARLIGEEKQAEWEATQEARMERIRRRQERRS